MKRRAVLAGGLAIAAMPGAARGQGAHAPPAPYLRFGQCERINSRARAAHIPACLTASGWVASAANWRPSAFTRVT